MTALREIVAALVPDHDGWRATIPATWLQGRTCYGGLSSALALHVAQGVEADLPPLRSAQIAFVGPLGGSVTIRAQVLRRGRNAAFVAAEVSGEAGLGVRATFVFMRDLGMAVDHAAAAAPPVPMPADDDPRITAPEVVFTGNFDFVAPNGYTSSPAEWLRWVRLKDAAGVDPAVALLTLADALPPAALRLVGRPAPLSSLTWQFNLLSPTPTTTDGWWLMRSQSDHARAGISSEAMTIWGADGTPVARQLQSVAIFA